MLALTAAIKSLQVHMQFNPHVTHTNLLLSLILQLVLCVSTPRTVALRLSVKPATPTMSI